jgi:3-oxoacyl-(acyl-carrier-protein) synthase
MGFWKKGKISNLNLLKNTNPGTIAGEGASFFLLTREESAENYARICGFATRFNPGLKPQAVSFMEEFLSAQKLDKSDIDLVIMGLNGDPENDAVYRPVMNFFGHDRSQAWYKHLCGEHYLASSFALWLGAKIMKSQSLPGITRLNDTGNPGRISNILIYNHYKNLHHSIILVSSC